MHLSELNSSDNSKTGKTIVFPEFHQIYRYDCVASALVSILAANNTAVRENEIMRMAGTTHENGTDPAGVIKVLKHFKVPHKAGSMTPQELRNAISAGHPILLMLQAYRDNSIPYGECWDNGHGVVCIGYHDTKFIFEDPSNYTRTWLDEPELLIRWHDTDENGTHFRNWGCEILRKQQFAQHHKLTKSAQMK